MTDKLQPHPDNSTDEILTAEEVAALFRVPPSWVYRKARDGDLPSVKLGHYRRFWRSQILRFAAEGGTADAA
jgi:excisionase family DNA binding protein